MPHRPGAAGRADHRGSQWRRRDRGAVFDPRSLEAGLDHHRPHDDQQEQIVKERHPRDRGHQGVGGVAALQPGHQRLGLGSEERAANGSRDGEPDQPDDDPGIAESEGGPLDDHPDPEDEGNPRGGSEHLVAEKVEVAGESDAVALITLAGPEGVHRGEEAPPHPDDGGEDVHQLECFEERHAIPSRDPAW